MDTTVCEIVWPESEIGSYCVQIVVVREVQDALQICVSNSLQYEYQAVLTHLPKAALTNVGVKYLASNDHAVEFWL